RPANAASAARAAPPGPSAVPRSAGTTTGSCDSSAATARSSRSVRDTSAMRAPARSSARAIAAPIPRPAPVTSAVRPASGSDIGAPSALVELDHAHRARRRRLDAEVAQRALVEVLLDEAEPSVLLLREDVHRAYLGELLRERRVGGDGRVDLDV